MKNMRLFSVEAAFSMDSLEADQLYAKHVNGPLARIFENLGYSGLDALHAEGTSIYLRDGRELLDFSSGLGILGLGHNHPRILAAERLCSDQKIVEVLKVAPSRFQAVLAHNLAQFLPSPLSVSFFSVSGAEAVEAAMKLCERAQGTSKTKFITTSGSFHGRTHGALSLTRCAGFHDGFLRGLPDENIIEIPFGDLAALQAAIDRERMPDGRSSIAAAIIEPVQGQGVEVPPAGYLEGTANICRQNGILIIFDEVKVGLGRTGRFCAFQRENVVPDVVTLSKALGGGKHAISAMVTSPELFRRAYGTRKTCALHGTTFGGMATACAVAIETLNVLRDERLIENAELQGEHLRQRLIALQKKYPTQVKDIRGQGLLQAVQFNFDHALVSKIANAFIPSWKSVGSAIFIAATVRRLFETHGIVVHFSGSHPDILHLMPPLVVKPEQVDRCADAIDEVLSRGFAALAADFLKGNLRDLW